MQIKIDLNPESLRKILVTNSNFFHLVPCLYPQPGAHPSASRKRRPRGRRLSAQNPPMGFTPELEIKDADTLKEWLIRFETKKVTPWDRFGSMQAKPRRKYFRISFAPSSPIFLPFLLHGTGDNRAYIVVDI